MPLTPETLTRHELNGLHVEVVDAANPDLVGIAGRIVVETMHTFMVDDGSRVRQVPKRGATFEFAIPRTDEAADAAKASGTASKLRSDTTGGFDASQSDRLADSSSAASPRGIARAWPTLRWMAHNCSHDPPCAPKLLVTRNGDRT